MKHTIAIVLMLILTVSCEKKSSGCADSCRAGNGSKDLTCKLTTPELEKRKQTVLASLKSKVQERRELKDGYAFKFPGDDSMIDELAEFVKTERECCSFFTFNISVGGDKKEIWLEMTGPEKAKNFIVTELEL